MPSNDIDRLRSEYARRRLNVAEQVRYSMFSRSHLFAVHQRQRSLISLLQEEQISTLAGKNILEIGCGTGSVLLEYLGYGATIHALTGIDLLNDRLIEGRERVPQLRLICANGQTLPFPKQSYDIVLQYTAFSSILNLQVKKEMATEMLRVLHPNGLIVWYDFWLNPKNSQTRGIRKLEIRQLFPNCEFNFKRITLAPPLARRLVSVSWLGGLLMEKLVLLNTHFLVAIRPKRDGHEA